VLTYRIRLITLENTLELKILVKWNIRDESIKYHEHLNIINENVKERLLSEDRV
jgi:hypothetical protein